jgi:hypothetical protein
MRSFTIAIFCATVLSLSSCPSNVPDDRIGPDGGELTDEQGYGVVVPPGALGEKVAVSVQPKSKAADLNLDVFQGAAAEFGPDGTTFSVPVTILLPAPEGVTPGTSYSMFQLDKTAGAWMETEFSAITQTAGSPLKAAVTHFTTYAVFPEMPKDAMRGKFKSLLQQYQSEPETAFNEFVAWFKAETAWKEGDKVHTEDGYYVLEQIFFHLLAKDNAQETQHLLNDGEWTNRSPTDQLFNESFDCIDYSDASQKVLIWDLLVAIHWGKANVGISILDPLDGAQVAGNVTIGTLTFAIDKVDFLVDGRTIGTDSEGPFSMDWDTSAESEGEHTLKVIGYFGDEPVPSEEVKVVVGREAPSVSAISPADGTVDVPVNTTITVTFSETMDHGSAEAAFSLSPAAAGSFTWPADNRMTFVPGGELLAGTNYTAHVGASAMANNGLTLSVECTSQFSVILPRLAIYLNGAEVQPDGTCSVALSPSNDTIVVDGSIVNLTGNAITLSGLWGSTPYGNIGCDMTLNGAIPYQANVGDIEPGESVPFGFSIGGQTSIPFGFSTSFHLSSGDFTFWIVGE